MSNGSPQTYLVAQSPEVLAMLMRDNQSRDVCQAAYTTPASVFNSIAVNLESENHEQQQLKALYPMPVKHFHNLKSVSEVAYVNAFSWTDGK